MNGPSSQAGVASFTGATMPATVALHEWRAAIIQERQRQRDKGYDLAHDREHGADQLLTAAQEYGRRGEPVKAAALVDAAREVLAATVVHAGGSDQS